MTPKDSKRYKTALLRLRDRLTSEVERLSETVLSDAQAAGEHDHTVSEAIEKELLLEQTEEHIRQEVSAALERIESGTYGICEECGQPIPLRRLDAVAFTRCCVVCEQKLEAG